MDITLSAFSCPLVWYHSSPFCCYINITPIKAS